MSALVFTTAPFAIPMEVDRVILYQSLLGARGRLSGARRSFPLPQGDCIPNRCSPIIA